MIYLSFDTIFSSIQQSWFLDLSWPPATSSDLSWKNYQYNCQKNYQLTYHHHLYIKIFNLQNLPSGYNCHIPQPPPTTKPPVLRFFGPKKVESHYWQQWNILARESRFKTRKSRFRTEMFKIFWVRVNMYKCWNYHLNERFNLI